jgi:hypothetical protein
VRRDFLICAFALAVAACMAMFVSASGQDVGATHYSGVLSFRADYDVVFLPAGMDGIYFDADDYSGCSDSSQLWKYWGPLKITTLLRDGKKEPLESESQLTDVLLNSVALSQLMAGYRAVYLLRAAPGSVPHDTLVQSKVTGIYTVVEDGAQDFIMRFQANVTPYSIMGKLCGIPGISECQGVPIAYPDTESDETDSD